MAGSRRPVAEFSRFRSSTAVRESKPRSRNARSACNRLPFSWPSTVAALVQIVEAHFVFCREDPDRARFFFALVFGPQGQELMGEVKLSMRALPERLIAAMELAS